MEYWRVAATDAPLLSLNMMVTGVALAAAIGTPDISPVVTPKDNPAGNDPAETLHEYGYCPESPPFPMICTPVPFEYGTPTPPAVSEVPEGETISNGDKIRSCTDDLVAG